MLNNENSWHGGKNVKLNKICNIRAVVMLCPNVPKGFPIKKINKKCSKQTSKVTVCDICDCTIKCFVVGCWKKFQSWKCYEKIFLFGKKSFSIIFDFSGKGNFIKIGFYKCAILTEKYILFFIQKKMLFWEIQHFTTKIVFLMKKVILFQKINL